MLYQQGDVLIEKIDAIPSNVKEIEKNGNAKLVLAEGEATGHSHTIDTIEAPNTRLFAGIDIPDMFLQTSAKTTIKHEEHHHIDIPAGNWKIRKVQEYDHFAEEARAVQD